MQAARRVRRWPGRSNIVANWGRSGWSWCCFQMRARRYLSKFYDNKWMRENGFLELEFGEVTLGDLLISKSERRFIRQPWETRCVG